VRFKSKMYDHRNDGRFDEWCSLIIFALYVHAHPLPSITYRIETRSLATKQDDPQWSSFVYWVVMSTFYAEEEGISQEESLDMPLVGVLGQDYNRMYRDAIRAVGNYGEIYDRNVNARVQRQGRNELNIAPLGPQHYPLPLY